MSEESFKRLISGRQHGFVASAARFVLRGLSIPYSIVMGLRNAAFDAGLKKVHRVRVPVVSIGNLTTGGTGKTPVVARVVQMLQELGHQPGIVSRGYRADASGENDEKRVLARLCPGVPHQQHPDRVLAANRLIDENDIDVIVLDDAFQHRRLHRDLNIVLIDATNPFGYGHVLPRGLLRESPKSLNRADLVLITRADAASPHILQEITNTVIQFHPAVANRTLLVSFRPDGLVSHGGTHPLSDIHSQPVTVMTAIGNPEAFVKTCRQIGADVVTSMFFPDHHHYTEEELNGVHQHAVAAGAPLILTTLKDLVKIPSSSPGIRAVNILADFVSPDGQSIVCQLLRDTVSKQQDVQP